VEDSFYECGAGGLDFQDEAVDSADEVVVFDSGHGGDDEAACGAEESFGDSACDGGGGEGAHFFDVAKGADHADDSAEHAEDGGEAGGGREHVEVALEVIDDASAMIFHGFDDAFFDFFGALADAFEEEELAEANGEGLGDGAWGGFAGLNGGIDIACFKLTGDAGEEVIRIDIGFAEGEQALEGDAEGEDGAGGDDP